MNNKILVLAVLALLFVPAAAFSATGLGAAYTFGLNNGDNSTGAALSINTPAIPGTVQTLRFTFSGDDYFSFALADDWWVIQENISGSLDFYIGLGFFAGITSVDDTTDFSLGGRIPVGLSLMPLDFAELFAEITPAMGLGFEPELYFPSWSVQGAVGFRIWF